MSLLGGGFDARALLRAAIYGAIGVTDLGASRATCAGARRRTGSTETAIHHHTGIVRKRDTNVPLARVEALDVHQGPLQRAFGVFAVDVQTGAGGRAARSRCRR